MPAHQQHHYVPEHYFKPWLGKDAKLVYFHWGNGRFLTNRVNPKSITKEPLLYAMPGAPAQYHVSLETEFFTPQVDNPGATVLHGILERGVDALTEEQRHTWTRYLMALRARTPEAVERAKVLGKKVLQRDLQSNQEDYDAFKPEGAPDTLEECIALWYRENFGSLALPSVIDHPETHHAITNMHWWLYDFQDAKHDLLTSDRPLIWHKDVSHPQFFLALPLTPRIGFFVTNNADIEAKLKSVGATKLAQRCNESMVASADEYVYATHDGHKQFVEKRLLARNTGKIVKKHLSDPA